MHIYSNLTNRRLIASMIKKGREPHSILICGEKGQGRKTLAKYIAAALMCERHNGEPCGECRSCRMAENGSHPDLITAVPNENGNYQAETIRALASDTLIRPNESDFKVYLIPDLDKSTSTLIQIQNILLKTVEEPPPHCVIIMTAASKQSFLPTIISRALCLTAEPCTPQQAEEWLAAKGKYPTEQILQAVECCHGNLGRCEEFLEGKTLSAAFHIARDCTDRIADRSEYDMLRTLAAADGKKQILRQAIEFIGEIARDACAIQLGEDRLFGCYREGSQRLSQMLDAQSCCLLYELSQEYAYRLDANCTAALTADSYAAELFRVVNTSIRSAM